MARDYIQSDVGNEWGAAAEAAAPEQAAPAAAPTQEQAGIPELKDDRPEFQDTLAGEDVALEGSPEAEEKEQAPEPSSFVEVKGGGKSAKFNLKADDPDLVKTLQYGLQAQTWLKQRDAARGELEAHKTKAAPLREAKEAWDTIGDYLQHGQYDAVVRAVLRDHYDAYEKQRAALEGATPDERWAHERQQIEAQRAIERKQFERELTAERETNAKRDAEALEGRLHSMATRELMKHGLSDLGLDPAAEQELSDEIWDKAWGMVDSYLASKGLKEKDITQDMLAKAFERSYAKKTSVYRTAANSVAAKTLDTKKKEAQQQVRAAVTERYPKQGPAEAVLRRWDGRSAAELTRKLLGK